jgi:glycine C-acetyltransferase
MRRPPPTRTPQARSLASVASQPRQLPGANRHTMFENDRARFRQELDEIRTAGLWKEERVIQSPQGAWITVNGKQVLCLCANNYLGLANDPGLKQAAKAAIDSHGLGLASVRFICGTQDQHKRLEQKISGFLGTEDTILYSSCWDANGGLFEILMGEQDAILSDALNHASIIDGIRLSKAQRFRYANNDMQELEQHLKASQGCRSRMIVTDGVFSMDGYIAKLPDICELADKYKAMVVVDDSHATGFFGPTGRGTPEHFGVQDRVDIVDSTFGKALGGASGGFTSGKREVVDLLRNRARPYLFSNTLAPAIVGSTIACIDRLSATTALRDKLAANTKFFREAMTKAGFAIVPGEHPICPIMLGDAKLAVDMAARMLQEGIYVIGFCFPVVPKGKARIRVQISAAHEIAQLETAVAAFSKVGKQLGVIA